MTAMTGPSATILKATADELCVHAPFDAMDRAMLLDVASRLTLGYFPKGTTLLSPDDGVVVRVYLVQCGSVQAIRRVANGSADIDAAVLGPGEMFPIGAAIGHRASVLTYVAQSDMFCYQLSIADFDEVIDLSPAFRHFATARLSHMLDQSRRENQSTFAHRVSNVHDLTAALKSFIRREPITVSMTTAISEVLALMIENRIGSVAVIDDQRRPVGIFTERDVLTRVAQRETDQTLPICAVMTPNPFCLPADASLFEAAQEMVSRRFRHVLVTEEGQLCGVLSERDLFAIQRFSMGSVAKSIHAAKDVTALAAAAADVRAASTSLVAQGIAAEQLTRFVTKLNDAIVNRALLLAAVRHPPPDVAWCWIGLGSEGRGEQTLATDQDNAIIFADAESDQPGRCEQIRAGLLMSARVVNHILDECGFPLCRGEIMASNPKWCLSEAEWRETFTSWLKGGSPTALLNAAIFFDFRALDGDASLAMRLREWLVDRVPDYPLFMRQMAVNALAVRPPLGLIRDFVDVDNTHPGTIDLKMYGARPFVDAARVFALRAGVAATNTADRLRLAAVKLHLRSDEVNAFIDAFHFVQLLRLRRQESTNTNSTMLHEQNQNRIVTDALNELDRRILKETMRQARKLQSRLMLDFQL